ncbi:MAG: dethiobiotin synthase [Candidatus Brocadiales bacterium]|nr:dethiobiotin synthase [Candidatus Bathyanammoxibius amoris]
MKQNVLKGKGIFVTGTDTGVGKTLVAAGIACLLHGSGLKVGVMKPVATGGSRKSDMLVSDDAIMMKEAAHSRDEYSLINPICLPSMMAPVVASRVDRLQVDWKTIWSAFKTLSKKYNHLVVEGIGGLLVPITDDLYVADMARKMKLPLIIVSRPTLGTINHTLLTIEVARSRGLKIKGVIFNNTKIGGGTLLEETNKIEIEKLSGVPVIASIPYIHSPTSGGIATYLHDNISLQDIL